MAPPVDNSVKIARSKALRQALLNQLLVIEDSADHAKGGSSFHTKFKVNFKKMSALMKSFEKHHNAVLTLVSELDKPEELLDAENRVQKEFLDRCVEVEALYYDLFEADLVNSTMYQTNVNNHSVVAEQESPLPKINIPTFKGDIQEFPTFIELFKAIVHNRKNTSDIEKFKILLTSLSGPPLTLLKNIKLVGDNYQTAYDTLVSRYDNKRLRAVSYWNAIKNAPHLSHDNVNGLRNLLDIFEDNLACLRNMDYKPENWCFVLSNMFLDRLDPTTRKLFEQKHASNDVPTYKSIKAFVSQQCIALESVALNVLPKHRYSNFSKPPRNSCGNSKSSITFFTSSQPQQPNTCLLCKGPHIIYRCQSFLAYSVQERINFIKSNKGCLNCLANAHTVSQCSSDKRCRTCGQNHHTLLHLNFVNTQTQQPLNTNNARTNSSNTQNAVPVVQNEASTSKNVTVGMLLNNHDVLLSTVLLHIQDSLGDWHLVRAILDSGSQSTFLTKKCATTLGLHKFNISLNVQGLEMMTTSARSAVHCTIAPVDNKITSFYLDAILVDKICDTMPNTCFNPDSLSILKNLKMADPTWHSPGSVQLLLGADIYGALIQEGRIPAGLDSPACINTIFGWTLIGKMSLNNSTFPTQTISSFFTACSNTDLNIILQKFWEVEEIPDVVQKSPSDTFCEKYFVDTTTRTSDGRYIVSLPFKIKSPDFGDTRALALRRFYSLEKRLLGREKLYSDYSNVIREYLDMGHMRGVPPPDVSEIHDYFYISHHAVVKKDSRTTPLRVVFDASNHVPNKPSLNEVLYTGPKLQRNLISILLNFRMHKYTMLCDISKCYRMIQVSEDHRKYQRLVWRFCPQDPVRDFELNVVTFGVNSSPYLCIRTLLQLADDYKDLPLASTILKESVYIDDCVVSCADLEQLSHMKDQLIELLGRGGFQLRKWMSNEPKLLADLPESHIQTNDFSLDLENDTSLKILGLRWNPKTDDFLYSFSFPNKTCTKRNLLSILAQIYDPLGLISPVTFFAKTLIQYLWLIKLDWDEPAPPEIIAKWEQFKNELKLFADFRIPRIINTLNSVFCQICGFCDASERGTCAVVYFRVGYSNMEIKTYLVCAKSKVAPVKRISLPRLELCAAVLLAKLVQFVREVFASKIVFQNCYAFTDSTVALSWIQSSPFCWKTFVSNRVTYIQDKIPPNNWYHVPSSKNAADPGSRGMFTSDLICSDIWWQGPAFLCTPHETWEFLEIKVQHPPEALEEERIITLSTFIEPSFLNTFMNKFSGYTKMKRVLAYVLRFFHNSRARKLNMEKISTSLVISELQKAQMILVLHIQCKYFEKEISTLHDIKRLPKAFRKLNPFLDKNNILRVGGRLCNSELDYDKKYPILLPSNCTITELLISEIHVKNLHSGVNTTLFLLFQNFWVFAAKKLIRKIISRCRTCWRMRPIAFQPPMGSLPKFRVSQAKAFVHVGVDLTGSFAITMNRIRGSKRLKAYVCSFICGCTKAVHLELISDLSTEAFLAGFRRFMARRGRVQHVYSDNGTNFVAASKYLNQIFSEVASCEAIDWHFNPPSAPHMGGLWESNIKSAKSHLLRVVGEQILTFEELSTVITQVEAVLNSRPLCPISTDPNDLTALTPGHFLTLNPLTAIPDPDIHELKLNRLSRWQLLQRLHSDFWRRWHREYLHTLQQRAKWNHSGSAVTVGTMVLIKNDQNSAPLNWTLGRIIELHPGADHIVRVATVRTTKGCLKRPVVKLCPLPDA